ncbi:hypothetical protein [Spirulina sp. 06S082]|uniref:hypothetical protein n=1 Tax=Spirulina sp. 06S082 TaxID=3110248 RepID=UPI002B213A00|nr:hypothetical protein [Spirulina sp. 06S082]MEA5469037.1 hypothetical protein [Spirulina sp. 06S082]
MTGENKELSQFILEPKQSMNEPRNAIAAVIVTAIIFFANAAIAQTYRGGDFTITLGDNNPETGRTYRGCDSQGNCISLQYGTSWRNGHKRGITWENGDYLYVVSWQDNDRHSSLYLTVFHGQKEILRERLYENFLK